MLRERGQMRELMVIAAVRQVSRRRKPPREGMNRRIALR
jgi:hypothetical protein